MRLARNTEEEALLADAHQALDDFRLLLRGRVTANADDNDHALRFQLKDLEDMLTVVTDSRFAHSLIESENIFGVDRNTNMDTLRYILSTARGVAGVIPTRPTTNAANSRSVKSLQSKTSPTRRDSWSPHAGTGGIVLSPTNSPGNQSTLLRQDQDSTSDPVPSLEENNGMSSGRLMINHIKATGHNSSRPLVPRRHRFRFMETRGIQEPPVLNPHQLDDSHSDDSTTNIEESPVSVRQSPAYIPAPSHVANSQRVTTQNNTESSKIAIRDRPLPAIPSEYNNMRVRSIETRSSMVTTELLSWTSMARLNLGISSDGFSSIVNPAFTPGAASSRRRTSCVACFDIIQPTQPHLQAPCGHAYCRECAANFVTSYTSQEPFHPLRCCNIPIPQKQVQPILSSAQFSELQKKNKELRTPVERRIYCPNPSCKQFIKVGKIPLYMLLVGKIKCPGCASWVCTNCQELEHQGRKCGKDRTNSMRFDALVKEKGWQRCQRCHRVVERTQGCLHMTCLCGFEFCYRCGAAFRGRSCGH